MLTRQMTYEYDTESSDSDSDSDIIVDNDNDNDNEEILILPILERTKTQKGPLILAKDEDLYVLCIGNGNYIIKSWITDSMVRNRVYNLERKRIEIIDPTMVEEDRRLLLPNCILRENYNPSFETE